MATAALSASDKDVRGDTQTPHTPPSSGSSEGSDFVILSRPPEAANLGSPNDFQVTALTTPFANGGDVSTMMSADHLMSAFNGLKQENAMLKGQLSEMNKAMQSRIAEIQTMRDEQTRMNKDLKEKHQKAKTAVTHYQDQVKNLSERLKELIEKDNQSTVKVENMHKDMSKLQVELRKSQAAALARSTPPASTSASASASASNSDAPSSAPSSLLTQMQEDLKNAQETRADIKRELQQMEEAGRQSEEALQKVNDSELQRLQQAIKRKDEEKQDLLKMNQELQQQLDDVQKKGTGIQEGLRATDEDHQRPQNSASLPSSQLDGEYIEEEQGFSLMRDSREFAAKQFQGFDDILKQLQNERERSDKLSTELKEERTRAAKLEADLQVASRQLMERSVSFEEEVSEINQKHQAEMLDLEKKVDELTLAAQEPRHDSGVQLKHQVRSLVSELQSRETDIKDRDNTIDNLNAEIGALRMKIGMYHDDMEKEREQNTQLVDTLQTELHRQTRSLEAHASELQQKQTLFQGEKQKALHAELNHDRLKEEYDQLFADYDNLTRSYEELRVKFEQMQPMLARQREIVENQDTLVARLFSAEEAIKAKDEENQKFKEEMMRMKSDLETVPVLRAQAEVYKADFDAERAAREKAHAEKEVLMNELETLRAEYEQIQQEAATQAQPRVREMQERHREDVAGQQRHDEYGMPQGGVDDWGTFHNEYYGEQPGVGGHREGGPPHQSPGLPDRNLICPKCMEQFPDMDSLQIHVLDCIQ